MYSLKICVVLGHYVVLETLCSPWKHWCAWLHIAHACLIPYHFCWFFFQIQSRRPPCSDFYKCSQVRLKPLEEDTFQSLSLSQTESRTDPTEDFSVLNNAIDLGFTLIILWQVWKLIILTLTPGLQIRMRIGKLFSLFLIQNICCWYSKEPSQWDISFEHLKHMFKLTGKKIIKILRK